MKLTQLIFPVQSRKFRGQRWISILLRSLHLVGIAGVGAAFLNPLTDSQWLAYLVITLVTGSIMMCLEIWSNGIWLIQLRGLSTLLKLLLLGMTFVVGLQAYILIAVILISGIISHAPGRVRYYQPFKPESVDAR